MTIVKTIRGRLKVEEFDGTQKGSDVDSEEMSEDEAKKFSSIILCQKLGREQM